MGVFRGVETPGLDRCPFGAYMVSAFRQAKHTVPEGRLDNRPALQLQRR